MKTKKYKPVGEPKFEDLFPTDSFPICEIHEEIVDFVIKEYIKYRKQYKRKVDFVIEEYIKYRKQYKRSKI